MAAPFFIASTEDDYRKLVEFDKRCGLLTRSRDSSQIIKVAHIIDESHYEYFITTEKRLIRSGINYRGKKTREEKIKEKQKKKERTYSMVFTPNK